MSAMLGQCLVAWRPAKRGPSVVASAKRRQRSAGSKVDVYERMMETLVDVRSVVVGNLHSTYRCQDWSQVVLLHDAIGEVAKKSLQLTRIEDEIKESHQTLNMHQGGGRGGVRRGGRNRVQAEETSQKAVQEAEKKISKMKKEKDAVLKHTIEIIDTVCIRVLQEEGTADELMAVVQSLAKELEAAKRKYTPDKLQGQMFNLDVSESDHEEQAEPEEEEDTRVVLSADDPSLGIEDVATLCQALSRLEEGQGLRVATAEGATCTIPPSHQPRSPSAQTPSQDVAMMPIELHQQPNTTPAFEDLLSSLDTMHNFFDDTSEQHLAQRMFDLEKCGQEAKRHCISGADKLISDGILQLDTNEYVVFDSTCQDVHVRNTVIQGGTIVCVGQGCSTMFSGVQFENCSLVVTGGAHATVNEHTSFTSDGPHIANVFVDGAGSSITADNVTVTGGRAGVVVQCGARLAANRMHVSAVECQAVAIQGPKSSAELKKCQVQGLWQQDRLDLDVSSPFAKIHTGFMALKRSLNCISSVGILVLDEGHVGLEDVQLKSFGCGVAISCGGDAHITDSEVLQSGPLACALTGGSLVATNCTTKGFALASWAVVGDEKECSAKLTGCSAYGGQWGGLFATGPLATLQVDGGTISQAGVVCVLVSNGAQACLHNMTMSNSESGVKATGAGTIVEVHGCTLRGHSTVGAAASGHATMHVYRTRSKGNTDAGYLCQMEGKLRLENCRSENDQLAFVAYDEGSHVFAVKCDLQGSKEAAVLAYRQGCVCMQDCSVLKPLQEGVVGEDQGSTVELHGGSVSKGPRSAIRVNGGAVGRIANVTVSESEYGIHVSRSAHAETDKCRVEACIKSGIASESHATVEVSRTVTCKTVNGAGYNAIVGGMLKMKDNCTSRADKVGCFATHEGQIIADKTLVTNSVRSGFTASSRGFIELRECKVLKSGMFGVESTGEGSHVEMNGCTISKSDKQGVSVVNGGGAHLKAVSVTHTTGGSGVLSTDKGSQVLLEACLVEDNAHAGVYATEEAVIELRDTHFARNKAGDRLSDSDGRVVESAFGKWTSKFGKK